MYAYVVVVIIVLAIGIVLDVVGGYDHECGDDVAVSVDNHTELQPHNNGTAFLSCSTNDYEWEFYSNGFYRYVIKRTCCLIPLHFWFFFPPHRCISISFFSLFFRWPHWAKDKYCNQLKNVSKRNFNAFLG